MTERDTFTAEMIQGAAGAWAGFATSRLFELRPDLEERHGPDAFEHWKSHHQHRLRELASALTLGQPALFEAEVRWARRAFVARELPIDSLKDSLRVLRDVLADQLPADSGKRVREYLELALASLDQPDEEGPAIDDSEEGRLALSYLEAVLEGDRRKAIARMRAAVDAGLSLDRLYEQVLVPAQREIGRLWHLGELSVAEEHFATRTTQRVMDVLSDRAPGEEPTGRGVICAAVEGNAHDMAIRGLADLFELRGWRAIPLGSDIPLDDLIGAPDSFQADLVVLSATLGVQLPTLGQAIARLRERYGDRVKILVGGRALDALPDLWRQLGADAHAPTMHEALTAADRLFDE